MTWILALYVIVGNPVGVRYFLKKIKKSFLLIPVLLVHLYCVTYCATSFYKALHGVIHRIKPKGLWGRLLSVARPVQGYLGGGLC